MPWKTPQPLDSWGAVEKTNWQREIWTRFRFGTFTMTGSPIFAGANLDTPVLVVGLRVGMPVHVTAPVSLTFGLFIQPLVLTKDVLMLRWSNTTAGPLFFPDGTYSYMGILL